MSLFGQSSFGASTGFGGGGGGGGGGGISLGLGNQPNPMKDVEVTNPPDDSISCMRFSPPSVSNTSYLIAGSWDNNVRCWEIQGNGQSVPKTQQSMAVIVFTTNKPKRKSFHF
jgi:mRNA export factor